MHVRHVVGYTADGAVTGGVFAAALAQLGATTAAGYSADLVVATDAPDSLASRSINIRVARAWRGPGRLGLRFAVAPTLTLRALFRLPTQTTIHLHLCRDLSTTVVGLFCVVLRQRFVVQPHGMLSGDGMAKRAFDVFATKRILRAAQAALVFGEQEARDLRLLCGSLRTIEIINAAQVPAITRGEAVEPEQRLVFVGRIARSKCAHLVAQVDPRLGFTVDIVGPGEDAVSLLVQSIESAKGAAVWHGAVDHSVVQAMIQRSWLLILPSLDDPFPLAVVEALALGTPCIVHRSNGLAHLIESFGAGLVIDDLSIEAVNDAVRQLASPETRQAASSAALALVQQELSNEKMVASLLTAYTTRIS